MSNLKNLVRLSQEKYSGYTTDSSDLYFIKDKGYIMNNGVAYGNGFVNAEYVSGNDYHKIVLTTASGNTVEIDCEEFLVDGMVDNVSIQTLSGETYLVVDFNTASQKEKILIPLTDIFDPDNYYTKDDVDTHFAAKSHTHGNITNDGKISRPSGVSSDSIAPYDQIVIARLVDGQEGKVYRSGIVFNPQSGSDTTALSQKGNWVSIQTPLTFDDNPTSGSENPVKSGGVYDSLKGKADKVSGATNGNFAGLDANGNLTDSGKKAADFANARHTHGSINNDGQLTNSAHALAPGDAIVIAGFHSGDVEKSQITFDPANTTNKTKALTKYGTFEDFQTPLTFDDNPTSGSTNPVKSGGVYDSLKGKVDKPTQNDGWVLKYQSESLYASCSPTSADIINIMFDYLPLMANHTPGTEVVITIHFTAPITASNPKLHVMNASDPTGFTAPIKYQGQALQPNTILAGDVYNFVYDSTDESWNLVGCIGPRIIDVPD